MLYSFILVAKYKLEKFGFSLQRLFHPQKVQENPHGFDLVYDIEIFFFSFHPSKPMKIN